METVTPWTYLVVHSYYSGEEGWMLDLELEFPPRDIYSL